MDFRKDSIGYDDFEVWRNCRNEFVNMVEGGNLTLDNYFRYVTVKLEDGRIDDFESLLDKARNLGQILVEHDDQIVVCKDVVDDFLGSMLHMQPDTLTYVGLMNLYDTLGYLETHVVGLNENKNDLIEVIKNKRNEVFELISKPVLEEENINRERAYVKVYAHFCRNEQDAREIAETGKLRTSKYQGREDRVFAVDLEETVDNDQTQIGSRVWAVMFTTSEQGYEGGGTDEVYWVYSRKDEKGGYVPLDMVFVCGPGEVIETQELRKLLKEESALWNDNDNEIREFSGRSD